MAKHTFPVEYRKPSSGKSPWKKCKAPCRLTVFEDKEGLRYEIASKELTYEKGWLNECKLDLGNAGLKSELQRTTLRLNNSPKDGSETRSFCGAHPRAAGPSRHHPSRT